MGERTSERLHLGFVDNKPSRFTSESITQSAKNRHKENFLPLHVLLRLPRVTWPHENDESPPPAASALTGRQVFLRSGRKHFCIVVMQTAGAAK